MFRHPLHRRAQITSPAGRPRIAHATAPVGRGIRGRAQRHRDRRLGAMASTPPRRRALIPSTVEARQIAVSYGTYFARQNGIDRRGRSDGAAFIRYSSCLPDPVVHGRHPPIGPPYIWYKLKLFAPFRQPCRSCAMGGVSQLVLEAFHRWRGGATPGSASERSCPLRLAGTTCSERK